MDLRRELSLFVLAFGLFTAVKGQDVAVTLVANGAVGVTEGMTASVCINVTDLDSIQATDTVRVSTKNEGASAGEDFRALNMVVTLISAREERLCFDIPTIDDNIVEPTENFVVELSEANGVMIDGDLVSMTIADNGDQIEVDFVSTTFSGIEGTTVSVCVRVLNGSVQLADIVNVGLMVTGITATNSADYVIFGSLSINIPFGARVGNISCTTITLIADTKVEEEQESFSLKLSPGSSVLVSDKTATVTIMDADRGKVVIPSLNVTEGNSSDTAFELVIELATGTIALGRDVIYSVQLADGTATADSDYRPLAPTEVTFSAGETGGVRRTVMVQIIGDEEGEPDETITVSLIPQRAEGDNGLTVAITIIDDEPKCESLAAPSNGSVSVTGLYQGSNATYTCESNTHSLSGAPTRTCDSNAMWTGRAPICTLIRCLDPPPLTNADFKINSYIVGSIATYECNDGYRFSTPYITRTCQSNSSWSTEEIGCEKSVTEMPSTEPKKDDEEDDGLSGGAIAGIVIAIVVVAVILVVLVVILVACLVMRHKNRSGSFKPAFDTQDQAPKINKADIGEPIFVDDPETGTAETDLTQSNEMLIY